VPLSKFSVPPDQRFFEDYEAGGVYELGSIAVSEAEIVDFARRFDPQYFHVDHEQASSGPFAGIIASGWHTVGLAMRLFVDQFLSHVASLASPGADEIRWPNPVRPGDTLSVGVTVLDTRPSQSKPDRGIVRSKVEAVNQRQEIVLSMMLVSFLARRHAG